LKEAFTKLQQNPDFKALLDLMNDQVELSRDLLEKIDFEKDSRTALYIPMRIALLRDLIDIPKNVTATTNNK